MTNSYDDRLCEAVAEFEFYVKDGDVINLTKICIEIRSLLSLNNEFLAIDRLNGLNKKENKKIIDNIKLFAFLIESLKQKFSENQTKTPLGRKIFFNSILPIDWDINTDILLIEKNVENVDEIIEEAILLGHQNIFCNKKTENAIYFPDIDSKDECSDTHKIISMAKQCIAIYDTGKNNEQFVKNYEALKNKLLDQAMYSRTLDHLSNKYDQRMIDNITLFLGSHPINEIQKFLNDQNILILSPGPSLGQQINKIKEHQKGYILLAAAQACPLLSKNGIDPDFIIAVDAIDYSQSLKNINIKNVKGLIASTQIHKSFLTLGFKSIFFWECPNSIYGFQQYFELPSIYFGGGSVSICALSLALQSKAKSISIVGQDLVMDENGKYAKGISYQDTGEKAPNGIVTQNLGMKFLKYENEKLVRLFNVHCIDGVERLSPQDYFMYLQQIQDLVKGTNCNLINISKTGAVIEGFKDGDLCAYPEIKLECFNDLKTIEKDNYKIFVSSIKSSLIKINKNVSQLVDALNCGSLDITRIDRLEKKLSYSLSKVPEINYSLAAFVEKFERVKVKSQVSSLDENIDFSKILYEEILNQTDRRIKLKNLLLKKLRQ